METGRTAVGLGILFMAVLAPALPGPAGAQTGVVGFQEMWRPLDDGLETYDLAVGDVDGNGYLDLVCGIDGPNTLFLNTDGVLGLLGTWTSPDDANTRSVALGDVDGDGLPDLVCADDETRLYVNDGGGFGPGPVWSSTSHTRATDVALADIDGDRRLDLLIARVSHPSECYLNDGGTFGAEPNWVASQGYESQNVAAGDIDGDGDVDVVFGGTFGLAAYRNDGGLLQDEPAWVSTSSYMNRGISLADTDGDGLLDLLAADDYTVKHFPNDGDFFTSEPTWTKAGWYTDLVAGDLDGDGNQDLLLSRHFWNDAAQANIFLIEAYLIRDGLPDISPAWTYQVQGDQPYALALGDFDADGDLDLAGGNRGWWSDIRADFILENTHAPTLETDDWATDEELFSPCLALGDVDGDGLEDVVFGSESSVSLHLHGGESLGAAPAWFSLTDHSVNDLVLGDFDVDGDLDLYCGTDGPNTIFINSGGTFTTLPNYWGDTYATMETILGDVNRDGYLDLICGNWMGPDTWSPNRGAPPFFSSYGIISPDDSPTRALALADIDGDGFHDLVAGRDGGSALYFNRQGAFVSTPDLVFSGDRDVSSLVCGDVDGDGDPDLVCGTLDGQALLYLNTGSILRQVPVWEGGVGGYVFDVVLDDLDGDGALDLFAAGSGRNVLFLNRGGGFRPDPDFEWTADRWTYGAATCDADGDGDRDVVLARSGANGLLSWSRNRLQAPVGGLLPKAMPNNPAHLRNVHHEQPSPGLLRVHFSAVDEEGDPLWIIPRFQYEGEPVWRDFPLKSGKTADGPFPGSPAGTAASLDLDVTALAADTRPIVLKLLVRESPGMVAHPIQQAPIYRYKVGSLFRLDAAVEPNAGDAYRADLPLQVVARNVSLGGPVFSARVHFRLGGEEEFATADMTGDGRTFTGEIPATHVGPRGVEYYLEFLLARGTVTDPPFAPGNGVHALQVTVPDLQEEQIWPGSRYRLVTVPLEFPANPGAGLQDLLWDQPEFGSPYDPTQWRAFGYDRDRNAYAELDTAGSLDPFTLRPGRAFWLVSRQAAAVTTAPLVGRSIGTSAPFAITLAPGWNLVGHPFAFPVAWSDMTFGGQSASAAVALGFVEPPVGVARTGSYSPGVEVWEAFQGYWVKNLGTEDIVLEVPARANLAGKAPAPVGDGPGWRITVVASCPGVPDDAVVLGMSPAARDEWDPRDASNPPPLPGNMIDLSLWPGDLGGDIRTQSPVAAWTLALEKSFSGMGPGDEATLRFSGLEELPAGMTAVLVDRRIGTRVDLRDRSSYRFLQGLEDGPETGDAARFVLVIGEEGFVDEAAPPPAVTTALRSVYPNPANPLTVVRFTTGCAGAATIRIYDPAGRLVREIFNERIQPGGYEAVWRGDDSRGRPAATGVYLVRLATADGHVETGKVVLVR